MGSSDVYAGLCDEVICILSSSLIILLRKRELVALLDVLQLVFVSF